MVRSLYLLIFLLVTPLLGACSEAETTLKDGYYSAEMASFDSEGWKSFVTIYVANGKIITVEYDAKNEAGFLMSWDMDYIRWMKSVRNTYPNAYMRAYSTALLNWQDPQKVYPLLGAERYCELFKRLAKAAMGNSSLENKEIAIIPYPAYSITTH